MHFAQRRTLALRLECGCERVPLRAGALQGLVVVLFCFPPLNQSHLCLALMEHATNDSSPLPSFPRSRPSTRLSSVRPDTAPSVVATWIGGHWTCALLENRGTGAGRIVGIAAIERDTRESRDDDPLSLTLTCVNYSYSNPRR